MPDMTPERAIEVLRHCADPDYFEGVESITIPECRKAARMGAAALAEVAALRAENEKLKADDLGAIAKQIVEAFITLRRTGLDPDRDRFDAMIDDYLEITGAADPKKEGT